MDKCKHFYIYNVFCDPKKNKVAEYGFRIASGWLII